MVELLFENSVMVAKLLGIYLVSLIECSDSKLGDLVAPTNLRLKSVHFDYIVFCTSFRIHPGHPALWRFMFSAKERVLINSHLLHQIWSRVVSISPVSPQFWFAQQSHNSVLQLMKVQTIPVLLQKISSNLVTQDWKFYYFTGINTTQRAGRCNNRRICEFSVGASEYRNLSPNLFEIGVFYIGIKILFVYCSLGLPGNEMFLLTWWGVSESESSDYDCRLVLVEFLWITFQHQHLGGLLADLCTMYWT